MEEKNDFDWNPKIEAVIKNICKQCEKGKNHNMDYAKKSSVRYNMMVYTSIGLGFMTGILSTILADYDSGYLLSISSFVSGSISTALKVSKLEQKSAQYKSYASKYNSLENNIRRQLSLEYKDRINAGKYLEWVCNSYDELFENCPIPLTIHDKDEEEKQEKKEETVETEPIQIVVEKIPEAHVVEQLKPDESRIDLNRFSDNKMKYELGRLYGH